MQGECPRHGSPLSGKVCPRRPTLGMPPSGDKDDGTPGAPPVSVSGTRREGCAEHRSAPALSQPRRDWAAPGWPANRRTVWVGQGSGYSLKDASPPMGIPRCPPSQYAVSGSTRSSPVRTASRGNVLAWSPAPLSSPATAQEAAVREGRGRGSAPRDPVRIPSAVTGHSTPATRVSAGTGGCADLFTARDRPIAV